MDKQRYTMRGDLSESSMLNEKTESADFDGVKLSEENKELICLVALGLTDSEIAAQLEVPNHVVAVHVAEVLGKLGARVRLELLLYAFSEPTLYRRVTAKIANK